MSATAKFLFFWEESLLQRTFKPTTPRGNYTAKKYKRGENSSY